MGPLRQNWSISQITLENPLALPQNTVHIAVFKQSFVTIHTYIARNRTLYVCKAESDKVWSYMKEKDYWVCRAEIRLDENMASNNKVGFLLFLLKKQQTKPKPEKIWCDWGPPSHQAESGFRFRLSRSSRVLLQIRPSLHWCT